MEDRVAWLRLLRSRRVGISTFFRLMSENESAEAALDALVDVARDAGVKDYAPCPRPVAQQEMDWAETCGASMLCFGAPGYPALLSDIPDPPPILWAIGRTELLGVPSVALVGARNASSLGLRMTRRLSGDLGRAGHVVVSGLARGIDTAAHEAALDTGTIAVCAGGVDVIYPQENTVLAEEIARRGLRLSEAPMGLVPQARHFPRRNRIISGLARATVVVEAAAKSGSVMTAEHALEQGREVFAVPGHPFDARSAGCNRLIRDGATLLRGSDDALQVLSALPSTRHAAENQRDETQVSALQAAPAVAPDVPEPDSRSFEETVALHQQILDRLSDRPLSEDALIRALARPVDVVSPELTSLELDGAIARGPDGTLMRKH